MLAHARKRASTYSCQHGTRRADTENRLRTPIPVSARDLGPANGCMQLEAGHAGMQALERGKRGLRDRAVWRARQGVLHRSGSGVVDARGAGRNT